MDFDVSVLPQPTPRKRPALVWVISIIYFLCASLTILSIAWFLSRAFPFNATLNDNAAMKRFLSRNIFDFAPTLVICTLNLAGAVLLFLLKKSAFHLFATAFIGTITLTIYSVFVSFYPIFSPEWLGAMERVLVVAIISWPIKIAVLIYSKRLINRGILR